MTNPESKLGFESTGFSFEDYSEVAPVIEPEGLNRRRRNVLAVIGGTVAVILGLSAIIPAKADGGESFTADWSRVVRTYLIGFNGLFGNSGVCK